MTFTYGDPFARLQYELDRMLASAFGTRAPTGGVYPPVNVFDGGVEFVVKADLPGIAPEKVDVSIEGETLTLRGERTFVAPSEDAAFHRRERDQGRFRRVVRLPARVDAEALRAEYRDGVLTVHVPKAKELKPRRLEIQVS